MSKVTLKIGILALSLVSFGGGFLLIQYRLNHPPPGKKIEKPEGLVVYSTPKDIPLEPWAEVWEGLSWQKVQLYPQNARIPYGVREKELQVKALYNQEEVAFLLEFKDQTENRTLPANPDGCALLFVPQDAPATAQMMGYGSKANVWQWLADRDKEKFQKGNPQVNVVRELIAHGPATQKEMPGQYVEGKGVYQEGKWRVFLKRSLAARQEQEFDLGPHSPKKKIAFALWDGETVESFARKSIAILRDLLWEEK